MFCFGNHIFLNSIYFIYQNGLGITTNVLEIDSQDEDPMPDKIYEKSA